MVVEMYRRRLRLRVVAVLLPVVGVEAAVRRSGEGVAGWRGRWRTEAASLSVWRPLPCLKGCAEYGGRVKRVIQQNKDQWLRPELEGRVNRG